jgi:DNA-binding MarR family transcriptional regulator
VQRLRSNHLNGVLFADPAWDILLELYIARHEQRVVTVSNAALATTVPASTALRWLGSLVEDGWLERQNDRVDHRRINVSMPDATFDRMNDLLDDVMDSDRKLGLARIQLIE